MMFGLALSLRSGSARAQEAPDAGAPPAPPGASLDHTQEPVEPWPEPKLEPQAKVAEPAKAKQEKTEKTKRAKKKKLEFGGRVIARGQISKSEGQPDWTGGSLIDSARARADYRNHGLHTKLSIELAGKARIKDAFVQLRVHGAPKLDVRAGQFKMPFSAIELESRWTLPTADRGLLHSVLVDRLQVAGRSVGAMMALAPKASWRPRLDAGVFQGFDDAGNALDASIHDRLGQDAILRIGAEPVDGITLGASGQTRVGQLNVDVPPVIRRAYAGEIDATLETNAGPGTLRGWVEVMAGTSWIRGRAMPCRGMIPCKAPFTEARAIAAYRLGGRTARDRYVELYGLGGAMDPDRDTANDRVVELSGGITFGAWDLWRVQAEVAAWRLGANAPLGITTFAALPADSTRILVQLGAKL